MKPQPRLEQRLKLLNLSTASFSLGALHLEQVISKQDVNRQVGVFVVALLWGVIESRRSLGGWLYLDEYIFIEADTSR